MAETKTRKRFISSRLILCILGTIGCGLMYSLRVNLSVAIVSMVNQTSLPHNFDDYNQSDELCYDYKSNTHDTEDNYTVISNISIN